MKNPELRNEIVSTHIDTAIALKEAYYSASEGIQGLVEHLHDAIAWNQKHGDSSDQLKHELEVLEAVAARFDRSNLGMVV